MAVKISMLAFRVVTLCGLQYWRQRRCVPSERWYLPTYANNLTSQKTKSILALCLFIVDVKPSSKPNLTVVRQKLILFAFR